MTLRTNTSGSTTVYAGTRAELAVVAQDYARGRRGRPTGHSPELFGHAAAQLADGVRIIDLGAVRFYADRADGTPFRGPFAPEPDPVWLAGQMAIGARR